jgi:carbamoyltransferase
MAGGVFSNVRINEEVHRLPEVDRIFVHPGMAACVPSDPEPLRDVYLGEDITEREAADALRQHGLTPEPLDGSIEDAVADLLVQGYVVARADGRMEYGPRWVIARFCISRRIARSTTG